MHRARAQRGVQLRLLVEYGCDRIQGYFAARPMPAEDIPAWLAKWAERRPEIDAISTRTIN